LGREKQLKGNIRRFGGIPEEFLWLIGIRHSRAKGVESVPWSNLLANINGKGGKIRSRCLSLLFHASRAEELNSSATWPGAEKFSG